MIFTSFLNFDTEFLFLNENLNLKQNLFNFINFDNFFYLINYVDVNFVFLNSSNYSSILVNFINQTEDIFVFNNLENVKTIYHYSIPNTKLAYPEPFIASASMMHSDLWFIHILIYQYWLWFVFVFLIIFFFITFICTVRWCNMRVRPRRETRGVSRSKCGDLITATVPVSWATSIIVHESTDAIDFYDGFGTSELVVGIRAYQWGWEYYYPKDIDLNYNIKTNYSTFVGNSLKYNFSSDLNLRANNMWKFYQNKSLDQIVTPSHVLFLPIDNFKLLNFLNFNDIGANPLNESAAFKKTRMFSKISPFHLISIPFDFNIKYKQLAFFFENENSYPESLYFGTRRQQNFLNTSAINNNYNTLFDFNSHNKWTTFNFNFFKNSSNADVSFASLYYFKKYPLSEGSVINNRLTTLFSFSPYAIKSFQKFIYFPNINQLFNDDSDKKKLYHPIYKLNGILKKKTTFNNLENLFKIYSNHDVANFSENHASSLFENTNLTYKTFTTFSSNQSILTASKSFRNFIELSPFKSTYNHNPFVNPSSFYHTYVEHHNAGGNFFFYNLSNTNWIDLNTFNKFASNRVYFDSPYSPIVSDNPVVSSLNFDDYKYSFVENTPTVLQGKEDQLPSYITSTYWNFYWNNSDLFLRLQNNTNYRNLHEKFYLPLFSFYYDYDFRNWQNLELFEDSFWESIYSIYSLDDYLNTTRDFYNYELIDKTAIFYYMFNNFLKVNDRAIANPLSTTDVSSNIFYANYFYVDDQISSSNLTRTSHFFLFPITNLQSNMDESYEALKFLNYFYNTDFKYFLLSSNNFFNPLPHSTIFDIFRSDYDEFSWFFDDKNFLNKKTEEFCLKNFFYVNYLQNSNLFRTYLGEVDFNELSHSLFTPISDWNKFKFYRFSDHINLRSPVRNAIVTYNAMQKVFRARFDEGRSNAKLFDYGASYKTQPFISSPRYKYEKLLSKNKENFFDVNFYKTLNLKSFNYFYDFFTSTNFYIFDFPFLLAMKSDASRYLWFDWFSKWGFYEVQPSSSSRYAIYGMPYFNKNFEFNTQIGENFTDSETYLLRIAKARRNYLPNWSYTPYLYAKSTNWYKNNLFFEILNFKTSSINVTEYCLDLMNWYWSNFFFLNFNSFLFFPSSSNVNTFAKSFWKPQNSIQSYYHSVSTFVDILTKREYLYREYFSSNNKIISLPLHFTASPSNPLINELKAAFLFADPIVFNNEYSRDIYYNSLNYFNFNVLKPFLTFINDTLNLSFLTDHIYYYFFNTKTTEKFSNNQELLKNQYRPMRKGITSMIRLHGTGAIAMPIDVKLQILASSKDVIHSWAIPSAGIKIDCVPGYSSHKVTIFLVSGIFWGQCMEICGRYHHWMPIIVYFMKRDLFFLWCTHFVFLSGANNMWNVNDRQFTNYVRLASFDKLSWLSEINNF